MASVQTPNKATLSASKVTELKALCSQNSLPVSGNKGELINRLLLHFESVQNSSTPQATPSKDLTLSSNPAAAPTHSEAPAPSKPAPATKPAGPTTIAKPVEPAQTVTPTTNNAPAQNPDQTHESSTADLSKEETIIDSELEKRKLRAQRFGLEEPNSTTTTTTITNTPTAPDDLKKSIRAKRFGITAHQHNVALDQPLADGKEAAKIVVKTPAELEWEARKRKRAEKFGLVDNPTPSSLNDARLHRKNQKFNNHRSRY
ncbi:uncharacterized protein PGTG_03911 [Puccinia graminis f. sp. tritici CRL 75-36-700-3]|uniref:SAP domain-containing protein n=1 Tax=Puccinia graminis f. sp. tritici (strain CRL 75-36-700-3 / race SCCL) TaxID=418459 RepID=E3K0Y0_PUCGT|nr:uncharacterized protein PGTG_03911 [Puccinia graminis f. sp. tritici CRL 75-36-700-3]EFP77955.1 hypothetical protein PGTG_03911 [Puccinia graminis f. sp. tritici CRL 75-36-700-3]